MVRNMKKSSYLCGVTPRDCSRSLEAENKIKECPIGQKSDKYKKRLINKDDNENKTYPHMLPAATGI